MRQCPMRGGSCVNECALRKEDGSCRLVDVAESIVAFCREGGKRRTEVKASGNGKGGSEKTN